MVSGNTVRKSDATSPQIGDDIQSLLVPNVARSAMPTKNQTSCWVGMERENESAKPARRPQLASRSRRTSECQLQPIRHFTRLNFPPRPWRTICAHRTRRSAPSAYTAITNSRATKWSGTKGCGVALTSPAVAPVSTSTSGQHRVSVAQARHVSVLVLGGRYRMAPWREL